MNEELRQRAERAINSVYLACRHEMPGNGYEMNTLESCNVTGEVLEVLFQIYEVPHKKEEWQMARLLINRILGKMKRCNLMPKGSDHLAIAMANRKIKKLWKDVYNSNGYEPHASSFWWVFLAIQDYIQQRGGDGVWGGDLNRKKFGECIEYRTLFHDDVRHAYNSELYSALFGWW